MSMSRRFARSLSILSLAVFLTPGAVADCRMISQLASEPMPCCVKTAGEDAAMDSTCCIVQQPSSSDRIPARTSAAPLQLDAKDALTLAGFTPAPAPQAGTVHPAEVGSGPPRDRLYLRLSVIRR